jgi:uncharacterized protein (TIGR04255 family)
MSKRYRNSPIAEALCALRFDPKLWDLTLPGRFYDTVKTEMPARQDDTTVAFQLIPQERNVRRVESPRAVFKSADALSVIQLIPGNMSLSRLRPYPTWDEFRSQILRCAERLDGILGKDKGTVSFGLELRYVNAILVDWKGSSIARYLNVSPKTPGPLTESITGYFLHLEYARNSETGVLIVETGSAPTKDANKVNLMLDLRVVAPPANQLSLSETGAWIDKAHEEIESAFEQCVTAESRAIFGELRE